MDPNQEIWEFGFDTLKVLAGLCASAHVAVQHFHFKDGTLRTAVSGLHDHVKRMRALQDSWRDYRHGKEGAPTELQKTWPDFDRAKAALQVAGPAAQQCKRLLSDFLKAAT